MRSGASMSSKRQKHLLSPTIGQARYYVDDHLSYVQTRLINLDVFDLGLLDSKLAADAKKVDDELAP